MSAPRFPVVNTPSEYRQTFVVSTLEGTPRIAILIFRNLKHMTEEEVDQYDGCRVAVQQWLTKHFNETLNTDGDDIEPSGGLPNNEDPIDLRV